MHEVEYVVVGAGVVGRAAARALALSGREVLVVLVHGPKTHGVPGLVNLYGIESPGLTASLALADTVVDRLEA